MAQEEFKLTGCLKMIVLAIAIIITFILLVQSVKLAFIDL